MVKQKKNLISLTISLTIVYLLLFPLGQLIRIERVIFGSYVVIHPIEAVSFPLTLIALIKYRDIVNRYPHVFTFFSVLVFSLLLSLEIYPFKKVFINSLYLARVFNFIGIFYGAYVFFKRYGRKRVNQMLILVGLSVLLFGWIQYLFFPDLRFLKYFGWDDHTYRLTGTFFDPGFTGIVLTLSALLSLKQFIEKKTPKNFLAMTTLIFGTLFTYSRSSYLGLIAGAAVLIYFSKHSLGRIIKIGIPLFLAALILLPRPGGEGIRLERTASIAARLVNYRETYRIWKTSPVFGIGFNNLCTYRLSKNPGAEFKSHSCSGADSSLMMLLATGGILGLFSIIKVVYVNLKKLGKPKDNRLLYSTLGAIFVHSLFTNSLFYPWVVGWVAFIVAGSGKRS